MNQLIQLINTIIQHNQHKRIDVKSSTYIASGIENNEKDPKFEVGSHVRIWKYKNIFAKGYIPN